MTTDEKAGKFLAWLRITRLQFYPMTWLAYTMGTVAYSAASGKLNLVLYFLGYLILFLIELCTILANEYFDYPSDRNNANFSIFTGGTRVLVQGELSFGEVRRGIFIVLASIPVFAFLLLKICAGVSQSAIAFLLFVGLLFGLGYTVPPLKFSYRGVGELVVAATHSMYVILCGYVFQGGVWKYPLPWLLSIPLFFCSSCREHPGGYSGPAGGSCRHEKIHSRHVRLAGCRPAGDLVSMYGGSFCNRPCESPGDPDVTVLLVAPCPSPRTRASLLSSQASRTR